MAERFAPSHQRQQSGGSGSMAPLPDIAMVPNPDFSFPRRPHTAITSSQPFNLPDSGARPASMHGQRPRTPATHHRKTASTLPTFSFNAVDTSGLIPDDAPPSPPLEEPTPSTPTRHRRNNSEFVGGDSRLGVAGAISSSPVKSNPSESAAKPNTHRHRRSVAVSSNDLSSIMGPPEPQPRLSHSLPTTPLEHPSHSSGIQYIVPNIDANLASADPFGPELEDGAARPPSRPRVGFSDNVEYIPRPLSTISSETESSMSTIRGHSVNNSISSVLSLSTPSPPSVRTRPNFLETTFEDGRRPRARSSLEISKRIEKEGEWLKGVSSDQGLKGSPSESLQGSPESVSARQENSTRFQDPQKKKQSISHAFGFDRRRSEPTIVTVEPEPSRLSALSLQEDALGAQHMAEYQGAYALDQRSSSKKFKDFVVSKFSRTRKEPLPAHSDDAWAPSSRSESVDDISVPGKVPIAESDLDAVFNSQASPILGTEPKPRIEIFTPMIGRRSAPDLHDNEDQSPMLDLDAALPTSQTPSAPLRRRDHLHSSRLTKDFSGPGGHYFPNPNHRRTESAPTLMPFDRHAMSMTSHPAMDDVFEEDEEDNQGPNTSGRPSSMGSALEESRMGVQIVDADATASTTSLNLGFDGGAYYQQDGWEPERPTTSYGNHSSSLPMNILEGPSPSIVEETILEESSPVEPVEIVEAHEEPRAPSLTKSSDSSETPTILATQSGTIDRQQPLITSEFYPSAVSSPDVSKYQDSFDTSRLGTSNSSITDNRTMSSYTAADHAHENRRSVDDVPSLTSSRSTMLSTSHANSSRRDISGTRTPSVNSSTLEPAVVTETRRKRSSIQSLSQLVGGSFGPRPAGLTDSRPQTAIDPLSVKLPKKKEHRLRKLMFWKPKNRPESIPNITTTSTTY